MPPPSVSYGQVSGGRSAGYGWDECGSGSRGVRSAIARGAVERTTCIFMRPRCTGGRFGSVKREGVRSRNGKRGHLRGTQSGWIAPVCVP